MHLRHARKQTQRPQTVISRCRRMPCASAPGSCPSAEFHRQHPEGLVRVPLFCRHHPRFVLCMQVLRRCRMNIPQQLFQRPILNIPINPQQTCAIDMATTQADRRQSGQVDGQAWSDGYTDRGGRTERQPRGTDGQTDTRTERKHRKDTQDGKRRSRMRNGVAVSHAHRILSVTPGIAFFSFLSAPHCSRSRVRGRWSSHLCRPFHDRSCVERRGRRAPEDRVPDVPPLGRPTLLTGGSSSGGSGRGCCDGRGRLLEKPREKEAAHLVGERCLRLLQRVNVHPTAACAR